MSTSSADQRFLSHLASAGEMVASHRFREAEVEILRALSGVPSDGRALNLLALVRFKQGRLEEARATYREITAANPDDATARLNLGLLALKLERFDEAVGELERAVRLAPSDPRAASYLGYAYAKRGDTAAAAAAFRRAGQETLAQRMEEGSGGGPGAGAGGGLAAVNSAEQRPSPMEVALSAPRTIDAGPALAVMPLRPPAAWAAEAQPQPVISFVLARLGLVDPVAPPQGEALRLEVKDEAHVRADAALASVGKAQWQPAYRRVRGRSSGSPLGRDQQRFYRLLGPGEVWVAGTPGQWVALSLDDDILYVREDRVLAFDDGISWEAGRVPGDGLHMLQFRGRGRVALQMDSNPTAIRISEHRPALVARARLLGWVGRVVAHRDRSRGGPFQISCEGDGVMLLDGARSGP
ncbi:MAG TPA: tetratricopeptide repeat protein [Polyangia bacterium]|jgi:uncharacterized protein (AIM24 family)|nr:tetratricopeptide repeat protein [Polyangia bacterium]